MKKIKKITAILFFLKYAKYFIKYVVNKTPGKKDDQFICYIEQKLETLKKLITGAPDFIEETEKLLDGGDEAFFELLEHYHNNKEHIEIIKIIYNVIKSLKKEDSNCEFDILYIIQEARKELKKIEEERKKKLKDDKPKSKVK